MKDLKSNISSDEIEKELLRSYRSPVIKLYNKGYSLGKLCRKFRLDISTILFLLRKSKIKKKNLFIVYDLQSDVDIENKEIADDRDLITIKDEKLIEKFFPYYFTSTLTGGYYWYWKEKFKKNQEKKKNCKHNIKHIRCGRCNKIICDASNMSIKK